MINKFLLSLSFILICISGLCQLNINKFKSEISFETLDKSVWMLVTDEISSDNMSGVLMFKHKPIMDSIGRSVQPVIAIVYEKINEKIDVIIYSINALSRKPYQLHYDLLGGYPDYSSDKHSVVFRGNYVREGVKHRIMLGYIFLNGFGIEIIGDSTEELYSQVESDITKFIKSVNIKY